MCCMAPGCPPTKLQVEKMARAVAELMGIFGISIDQVKDHRYYAKLDGYENERWDIGPWYDIIIPKVKWYRLKLQSGLMSNSLKGKVK